MSGMVYTRVCGWMEGMICGWGFVWTIIAMSSSMIDQAFRVAASRAMLDGTSVFPFRLQSNCIDLMIVTFDKFDLDFHRRCIYCRTIPV